MEGGILESWNPGPEQMFHFVGKRKCRHGSSIMGMQMVLQAVLQWSHSTVPGLLGSKAPPPLPSEEEACLWLSQGLRNPLDALVAFLSTYYANNETGVGLY
jgi:hypothetical protein